MYSTSLKGKIAWVTGSSRGIGRTIAEFLAECGADVALHGRSDARLVQYQEGTTLSDAAEHAQDLLLRIPLITGKNDSEEELE